MNRIQTNSPLPAFKKSVRNVAFVTLLSHLVFSGPASAIRMIDQVQSPYTAHNVSLVVYTNASAAGIEPWSLRLSSLLTSIPNSSGTTGSIILGSSIQKILNTIEKTPDGSVEMVVTFNYVDNNNKSVGSFSCVYPLNQALLNKLNLKSFDKLDNAVVTLTQESTPTSCPIEIQ